MGENCPKYLETRTRGYKARSSRPALFGYRVVGDHHCHHPDRLPGPCIQPVLILSGEEKTRLFYSVTEQWGSHLAFEEGWLTPPYFHLYSRHLVMLVFWLLQLRLLHGIRRSEAFLADNKHWFVWIWACQLHQLLYFGPFLFYLLAPGKMPILSYSEAFAIAALFILYIYLFYRPRILYGITGIFEGSGEDANPAERPDTQRYIPREELTSISERLNPLMQQEKPFLDPDCSLDSLAREIDISPWMLSNVLNRELGTNFNRYLNDFRIRHCLEMLEAGAYQSMSIEGIARECGFNNRNSFTQSFKWVQKTTPSACIRKHYPG